MRIVVDQNKCNGAGVCAQEMPNVFRFQEGSKKGMPIKPEVSASLEAKLRKVAAKCPAGAIYVYTK